MADPAAAPAHIRPADARRRPPAAERSDRIAARALAWSRGPARPRPATYGGGGPGDERASWSDRTATPCLRVSSGYARPRPVPPPKLASDPRSDGPTVRPGRTSTPAGGTRTPNTATRTSPPASWPGQGLLGPGQLLVQQLRRPQPLLAPTRRRCPTELAGYSWCTINQKGPPFDVKW